MNKLFMFIAVVAMGATAFLGACSSQQSGNASGNDSVQVNDSNVDSITSGEDAYLAFIEKYLVDSIGSQYSQGEVCIPLLQVIEIDDTDSADVKVCGSFWVNNYKISGDTLLTVSGGSHPGLFHLNTTGSDWQITGFDQVGDGSSFTPTAKKIFGDKFDAFQKVNSDDKEREKLRTKGIAEYVKKHNLKVTMYKDYGWPPVKLNEE
jgi:hypothetical protein